MPQKSYAVVVVGGGVTGLSCAYHLGQRAVDRVAICAEPGDTSASEQSPGYLIGGQFDNFSRVSHAHGADFGAALWSFGDRALAAVREYCGSRGIACRQAQRWRLITSENELREAEQAVTALNHSGQSGIVLRSSNEVAWELGAEVLAVQDEGFSAAHLVPADLLGSLSTDTKNRSRLARAVGLQPRRSHIEVELADGTGVQAEMVVLANHLGISTLLPELEDVFVAVADQWTALGSRFGEQSDIFFSANHGYVWGGQSGSSVYLGGGRFTRKFAGIGADLATWSDESDIACRGGMAKWLPQWRPADRQEGGAAFLDCRPCDELPVIGPMYGDTRILLGSGYMGTGLTQGFLAGACLADLVVHGRCEALPERLHPRRLRSLES